MKRKIDTLHVLLLITCIAFGIAFAVEKARAEYEHNAQVCYE